MKFVKRIRQKIRCLFKKHDMYLFDVIEDFPPSVEHKCKHCSFKIISYSFPDVSNARKIKSDFFKEHITTRFVLFEKDRRYMVLPFHKSLQHFVDKLENKQKMEMEEVNRLL